ncbi:MAG: hypothetical protein ACFN0W_10480 [Propionibacterium acidifaciens]|uniref:hypothetical protein n=1 Tax=Propionibacterium acidifaciens TaxID=556499 RepID=UPI003615D201
MGLFGLVIRDTALRVLAWLVVLGAMRGAAPASYRTSFPSAVLREAAVEHSLASDLGFLGLRDVVAPFTDRRFWVLGAWLGVCLLLRVPALLLQRGREYGSALLRPRGGASRRMRVRGPWGLAVRLGWISGLTWLLGTGVAAALLTGMGRGAVGRARSAPLDGGVLGASLGGDDPALSYVHFQGLLMGALIAVAGILVLQAVVADERSGRAEVVLATGRRRWEVVLSRAGWSLPVTLVLCATTALVVGLVAESELGGEANLSAAAWRDVLGQWPAVALVVALATLLVALGTRFLPAAWFIWGGRCLRLAPGRGRRSPGPCDRYRSLRALTRRERPGRLPGLCHPHGPRPGRTGGRRDRVRATGPPRGVRASCRPTMVRRRGPRGPVGGVVIPPMPVAAPPVAPVRAGVLVRRAGLCPVVAVRVPS